MKKCIWVLLIISIGSAASEKTFAQANELAQLALNIEKLAQFKQILEDLKKGYDIVSKGYTTVKDISEGNFNLHRVFLDGLMEVSPAVKNYYKVGQIISYQTRLVKNYKTAYDEFRKSNAFSAKELDYLSHVYGNLFNECLKNLDELITVVTAGKLRMSDDERLAAIDRIYGEVEDKLTFLDDFNQQNQVLAISRIKELHQISEMKELHGVEY